MGGLKQKVLFAGFKKQHNDIMRNVRKLEQY